MVLILDLRNLSLVSSGLPIYCFLSAIQFGLNIRPFPSLLLFRQTRSSCQLGVHITMRYLLCISLGSIKRMQMLTRNYFTFQKSAASVKLNQCPSDCFHLSNLSLLICKDFTSRFIFCQYRETNTLQNIYFNNVSIFHYLIFPLLNFYLIKLARCMFSGSKVNIAEKTFIILFYFYGFLRHWCKINKKLCNFTWQSTVPLPQCLMALSSVQISRSCKSLQFSWITFVFCCFIIFLFCLVCAADSIVLSDRKYCLPWVPLSE